MTLLAAVLIYLSLPSQLANYSNCYCSFLYVACTSMASLEEIFFYLSNLTKYYEDTTDIDKRRNIQRNSGQSYLPTGKDGQPHRRLIFTKEEKEAMLTEMHVDILEWSAWMPKSTYSSSDVELSRRSVPCLACQKFERAKTVVPELKPIKVVSSWHMIGKCPNSNFALIGCFVMVSLFDHSRIQYYSVCQYPYKYENLHTVWHRYG